MKDEASCPLVDRELFRRARRCWMCAYFEQGVCHVLPPTAYVRKGEVCTVRPEVNLFDLGCSLFVPGAHDDKPYRMGWEDKDVEQ